jgi:hypothetical protein
VITEATNTILAAAAVATGETGVDHAIAMQMTTGRGIGLPIEDVEMLMTGPLVDPGERTLETDVVSASAPLHRHGVADVTIAGHVPKVLLVIRPR